MAEKVRVGSVSEIPPGTGRELTAGGRVVALYNVEGQFHALDGVCPHAGGPLGQGELQGKLVTCPWHGWQFDVTTGQYCLNANLTHTSFAITIEGNDVYVEVP